LGVDENDERSNWGDDDEDDNEEEDDDDDIIVSTIPSTNPRL
jgi:hypothetical protein